MNATEWNNWFDDAYKMLEIGGYSEEQISIILKWFRHIRGSAERGLIGDAAVDGHLAMIQGAIDKTGKLDLYGSMTSRLFIYAPLILKEWDNLPEWQKNL
jgi:hypothetical protein